MQSPPVDKPCGHPSDQIKEERSEIKWGTRKRIRVRKVCTQCGLVLAMSFESLSKME